MRCPLKVLRTIFPLLTFAFFSAAALIGQSGVSATPATTPSVTLPGNENSFLGSDPDDKPTPGVLQIDYKEAIEHGLRHNLGLLLAGDQTQMARGERWKELSQLLPNISGRIQENVQTESLAALGFKIGRASCRER